MIREKYPPISATWPFDGNPPALGWMYALLAYAALMLIFGPQDALPTHMRPAANWAVSIGRWFVFTNSILFPLALGGAGVSYIRYRRHLLKRGETAVSRPWRSRVEIRFLFYLYATFIVVGVVPNLLGVCLRPVTPTAASPNDNLFDALFARTLYPLLAAIGLIYYDRRRIRTESRTAENRCQTCGYDLRASPTRCPECGAAPAVKS